MMDDGLLGQIECSSNTLHLCTLPTVQTQLSSAQARKHFAFIVNVLRLWSSEMLIPLQQSSQVFSVGIIPRCLMRRGHVCKAARVSVYIWG